MRAESRDIIQVDARGHRCPVPTLRLSRALKAAPLGAVIELLADDPLVRIDVPHFIAGAACELLSLEEAAGVYVIQVRNARLNESAARRGGDGAPPGR